MPSYPKAKYHPELGQRDVMDQAAEQALGDGWFDRWDEANKVVADSAFTAPQEIKTLTVMAEGAGGVNSASSGTLRLSVKKDRHSQ